MKLTLKTTILILFGFLLMNCKKDCLEKDKCTPSSYQSAYLIEQSTPESTGNTYYIDAENGKKKNNGLSESEAFKSIKQLSDIVLEPGDQILFKRNQNHFGQLKIEQSGTSQKPIYISSYGTGTLPIVKTKDAKDGKAIYLFNADYIIIQNLNVQGGIQAILLDGANYVSINGCRIGESSESGIRATGRYSETSGSNYGVITNCLIYSGKSGNLGDQQSTDGIQLMDGASNWHIYNNEIKAWAHSAVSIKPIYTSLNSNNNVVEHNLIDCGDIDYMRALDITGPENRASNNLFQKNIIKNQTVTSHLHGNDNIVAYNLFLGLKVSDASTQPWAIDFHVFIGNSGGVDRKEYVCHSNSVYNNVFYNYQEGIGIKALNSKSGTTNSVVNNSVINNIFYDCGSVINIDNEPSGLIFKNNLFYTTNTSVNITVNQINYTTFDFNLLSGTQSMVIQNNIEGNPLFSSPSNSDFSLQLGSPAIETGIDVGLTTDYNGVLIVGNPEIGILEF